MLISQIFTLEISSGRSFSNTDDFNITFSSNTIKINIEIGEVSIYRIDIIDLNNNIQKNIPEVRVQAGKYEHSINLQKGNYIVACYINGKMYSKKITIK
ncbi:MAG: hypothetical protein IKY54_02070 [Muribaculaceae bacterium]|nr:hypothetical protein [Muribaculaceae bacterium]